MRELQDELAGLKETEASATSENKAMQGQVSDLRLQLERLVYESKEAAITTDALREQNADLSQELEDVKVGHMRAGLNIHSLHPSECPTIRNR